MSNRCCASHQGRKLGLLQREKTTYLILLLWFQPSSSNSRPNKRMGQMSQMTISVLGNFLLIVGLVLYGFTLFAEYHARGKWAKNITGLLAGIGMMILALALLITPANAQILTRIAA